MAKSKLVGANSEPLEYVRRLPKVVDINPVGSQILVDLYEAQETADTDLFVGANADFGAPQGRVVKFGPVFANLAENYGMKIGDRVLLQGSHVPAPKCGLNHKRSLVEIHNIKAVLVEA